MMDTEKIVKFWVNGDAVSVSEADTSLPMLNFLRERLSLNRVRYGCGAGACGTIVCDGEAITSCDKAVSDMAGRHIETPENLGDAANPHPVLAALIRQQAVQCGYCISGVAMRVKALLDNNPTPSRPEILKALDNHLCRCGTHVRIVRAVEDLVASGEMA
jgi:nicotinate dehydrogenase subunit A